MGSTLRMKQNSELSSPASVLIWMHLEKESMGCSEQEVRPLCPLAPMGAPSGSSPPPRQG